MNEIINICPYLGMADDPATNTSFPSPWNYCHNSKPVEVVELNHQKDYCLSEKFNKCPVYMRVLLSAGKKKPLPSHLRVSSRSPFGDTWTFNWKIIPLSFFILALLFFAGFNFFSRKKDTSSMGTLTTQARVMELTEIAQAAMANATQTPPVRISETEAALAANAALTQTAFAITQYTPTPTITLTSTPTPTPTKRYIPPTSAPSKPKPKSNTQSNSKPKPQPTKPIAPGS